MIQTIIQRITNFWERKEIIQPDSREVYEFGLEVLISDTINTLIMIVLGLLYGNILAAVIYLATVLPIRTFGGGYHAKTHWGCTLLQVLSFSAAYWGAVFLDDIWRVWISIPLFLAIMVVCFIKAPVEHPYHPLQEMSKPKMKRICLVSVGIIFAISTLLLLIGKRTTATLIALSACLATISLLFSND